MNAPSGFWRRYAAYSLDATMLVLLAAPLLWPRLLAAGSQADATLAELQLRLWELLDASIGLDVDPMALARDWADDPVLQAGIAALAAQLNALALVVATTLFLLGAAWFIATEASTWQASPGKRLLGLRVTDLAGRRCGPGRTALRFVAGVPSWLLLNLGHAMAAWTPGKRALHDYIAGTRVELAPGAPAAMPGWARAWLWLQLAAFLGGFVYVLLLYLQMLHEAWSGGLG